MQTLTAVSFVSLITSGGSTRPWVVLVPDGGALVPYVVKLFTPIQTRQYQPLAKEVFGNVLAREFDLAVPDCALVVFPEPFVQTLPAGLRQVLAATAPGPKFASVQIPDAAIIDVARVRKRLAEYDLGTIFAFDNLVQNIDRGGFRNKPNLLINKASLIPIDHEQVFSFDNGRPASDAPLIPVFERGSWHYPFEKHLFFPLLHKLPADAKATVFDTFRYFLETLSVGALDNAANALVRQGIDVGDYPLIRQYLLDTKARSGAFCQLLKTLIS